MSGWIWRPRRSVQILVREAVPGRLPLVTASLSLGRHGAPTGPLRRLGGRDIASAPGAVGTARAIPTVHRALRLARQRTSHHDRALLHNNLPIHPGMWRTDIVIGPRLRKGDGLRAAAGQITGIPRARFHRRGCMIEVADVREGQRGPRLDPNTGRPVGVFHIVVPDLDGVHPFSDGARGPSNGWRWGGRPQ